LPVAGGWGGSWVERYRRSVDIRLFDGVQQPRAEVPNDGLEKRALTTGVHVADGGGGESLVFRPGIAITFDVPFPLGEDLLGNLLLASSSASINTDPEVRAPDPIRRVFAIGWGELEGHGWACGFGRAANMRAISLSVNSFCLPAMAE